MVAVCAFYKLSLSAYFVPECKSLTRRLFSFKSCYLKKCASVASCGQWL